LAQFCQPKGKREKKDFLSFLSLTQHNNHSESNTYVAVSCVYVFERNRQQAMRNVRRGTERRANSNSTIARTRAR
jgi:hypothetical protein